ncbi:MAG: chromosomal replication initiator protein DnaA [Candidatus Omnitrophica bacterium]|nr:chromosomal replication initiator protein DnaA [Candidatus Omnitrophota bacterium]
MSDSAVVWDKICPILSRELSEQSFKTWFSPVTCLHHSEDSLTLGVPDTYYGQWLKNHYEGLVQSAAVEVLGGQPPTIHYEVVKPMVSEPSSPVQVPAAGAGESSQIEVPAPGRSAVLNKNYTFDQFVIGPGNRFAHAAAMAVVDAPARNYNPLFIYGPVGLGKTHLMQSIAHEIKRRHSRFNVLYISSEKFTNQLISAIQKRSTQDFRNKYRTLDLLLIDDIHFLAEKEATQEEFFHTFNALYDAHKQIVVSSDRPPKDIPGLEERLVSRFGWGLVTDIQPPDFETRVAILKKKMERETIAVPDDVSYFIASKIKSNIRELEGALIRVVAYCSLTNAPLSLSVAQEVLRDSLKEEEQKINIDQIQRVVADYFHLNVSDLRSKRRTKSVVLPRQLSMYLIRSLTNHSLPEIGEFFGGRDHTTVLHACQKIDRELSSSLSIQKAVDEIKNLLKTKG